MTQDEFDWRAFLGEITRDPQEKQRLADVMNVSPITLTRWVSTGSRTRTEQDRERLPRPQVHSLRKLVAALPEYRELLMLSIIQEYQELTEEDFQQRGLQNTPEEPATLPMTCYERTLEAAATLSGELRFTTICDHILNSSLQQLDPERLGFAVTLLKCVQPQPGYKVRSMQEMVRVGSPPWSFEREERLIFRGAESLAGRSVATGRPYEMNNVRTYLGWLPNAQDDEHELSIATCPIVRAGSVAGCLRFSSTQAEYFTKERMHLIKKYSYLAIEMFEEREYCRLQDIELRVMPDEKVQMPFLRGFNRRVEDVLAQGEITNWMHAVNMALHQVENDLIDVAKRGND